MVTVSAPVQWLVVRSIEGVSDAWARYVWLRGLEATNRELVQKNRELGAALSAADEVRRENERLRLLVGLKERAPEVRMVHARVVAISPTPLFRSVRIDRGRDDGVLPGAAVVTHAGVVGRVVACGGGFCDVMLIVDANASTDVLVQRTRARARVRGSGRTGAVGVEVEQLARTADVRPGDVLLTSGVGEVFPKGLVVGTVVATEQRAFGLYQAAEASPAVDFGTLEEVLVLGGAWPATTTLEQRSEGDSAPQGAVAPLTPGAP